MQANFWPICWAFGSIADDKKRWPELWRLISESHSKRDWWDQLLPWHNQFSLIRILQGWCPPKRTMEGWNSAVLDRGILFLILLPCMLPIFWKNWMNLIIIQGHRDYLLNSKISSRGWSRTNNLVIITRKIMQKMNTFKVSSSKKFIA